MNFTNSLISSSNNTSNANIINAKGDIGIFNIKLYANKSINNNILYQDSYVSFIDFYIEVNTSYKEIQIDLLDEDYNPWYSSNNNILDVIDLIDQKYYIYITCNDGYMDQFEKGYTHNTLEAVVTFNVDTLCPNGYIYDSDGLVITNKTSKKEYIYYNSSDSQSGIYKNYVIYNNEQPKQYISGTKLYDDGYYQFYSVDNAGNQTNKYEVTLDNSPPIIICEGAILNSKTDSSFKIRAEDETEVYLYYKSPVMNYYRQAPSKELIVDETMPKGVYYFYVRDYYNNVTEEYYINYCDESTGIEITKISNTNQVYITWDIEFKKVLINNNLYNKSDIIKDEGNYEILFYYNDGNISIFQFEISCYFVEYEIVPPTCSQKGYSLMKCISCELITIGNETETSNHNYSCNFKEPTCIDPGGLYHYCIDCNASYITDKSAPLGHTYIYDVTFPTCTNEGKRIITCSLCDYYFEEIILPMGHSLVFLYQDDFDGELINVNMCENCFEIIETYDKESNTVILNFISFLKTNYIPYLVWILLVSVGLWSIIIGVRYIFLKRNEEYMQTKLMIKNYIIGIIVIFILIVLIPLLINGIANII